MVDQVEAENKKRLGKTSRKERILKFQLWLYEKALLAQFLVLVSLEPILAKI